jgi:hypothetical protein
MITWSSAVVSEAAMAHPTRAIVRITRPIVKILIVFDMAVQRSSP